MSVQLPEYIDFVRLSEDRAVMAGPATTKELTGEAVSLVERALPLLREGTTASDLAADLEISDTIATQLVEQLQTTGLLTATSDSRGYWEWAETALGVDGSVGHETTVALLDQSACGLADAEDHPFSLVTVECVDALGSALADVDLLLTLTVGEDPDLHHAVLAQVSDCAVDWIPARLAGSTVTVGPFGTPTIQGCYNCYDHRRRASTELDPSTADAIDHRPNQTQTPYTEYVHGFVMHVVLTEALAALTDGATPQSSGAIVEFDLTQFTMDRREVLPVPGCELCGTS
jgi:bacteriocin biosynthesis cyclodehydratase domain-containing protein